MESLIVYKSLYDKYRVGNKNDGGYIVVDLPGDYDSFISGGISNDISFEEDFLNRFPDIVCNAFDGTINSLPSENNKIIFHKKNLGQINSESITNLDNELKSYNNVFLKIDIEGHEFRLLPVLMDKIKKIKQLVVEFHSPADIHLHPNYYSGLLDIHNQNLWNICNKLNETHTLVHIHGNNGCDIHTIGGVLLPNVFECTYIRNDYVTERIPNDKHFPTEIDSPNIPNKPDYILRGWPYSR
jgi:hypothetical protein